MFSLLDPRRLTGPSRPAPWWLADDGSLRIGVVRGLALLAALVLGAAVLAVSRAGGDASEVAVPDAPPVEGPLLWQEGSVTVESVEVVGVAQPPDLEAAVESVTEALRRYVEAATQEPLLTGQPSAVLPSLFTARAQARLATADRAVLADESLPAVTALRVRPVTARLTLLTGSGGRPEVAVVELGVAARGFGGDAGGVTISRRGELVLVPADAGWQIDSYRLDLEATADGVPPFGMVLWPFGGPS